MKRRDHSIQQILEALQERAKELNCLYEVDEILARRDAPLEEVGRELIAVLPPGWQYPAICHARLELPDRVFAPEEPAPTAAWQSADITVDGERVGEVRVCYREARPDADEGPFLKEERRLINAIAERIGVFVMRQRIRAAHDSLESAREPTDDQTEPWRVLLDFLRRTDEPLLTRITRKMINHLCWNGVEDASTLLQENVRQDETPDGEVIDENRPRRRLEPRTPSDLTARTFDVASRHLVEDELVSCIQAWISEEKSTVLIKSLENPGSGVADTVAALERHRSAAIDEEELPLAVRTSLRVALLRRFFVDRLDFINVGKRFAAVADFYDLGRHVVYPSRSQGKLGGKGAGVFLAELVLRKATEHADLLGTVRFPRTWYIASDGLLEFIHHNNLEEVYNQKYSDIERVRRDYPNIIQLFKNSVFPPEIVTGLAAALDDFEERPLIVRSSSLLEDQAGSAFSGKYRSLFLANQGSKKARLEALLDAVAEVYASVFSPDPIEYRSERNLLDFREEMGILIQEVVGQRVGDHFLPAFSGVAFSQNEFRWSPRIRREDGLVRLVPGLGTRTVDRLGDDYPILFAPGQPGLRASVTRDEMIRYAPRKADAINLATNRFETIDVLDLLRKHGAEYALAKSLVSMVEPDRVRAPMGLEPDWEEDDFVVTFEGLLAQGSFVARIRALLEVLREKLGIAVDLEFASDGHDFYLLQCRAQSRTADYAPAPIPREVPRDRIVFTANRHVSNGRVPAITHVVFVDPAGYGALGDLAALRDVGRAVGRLNKLLPKRQFILMGPGRWGSRGDIRLGVSVTYADINNTAVLLEIAEKTGEYLPELSFGTHFFQDLVEAEIRYIPLYPDDPGVMFNDRFLRGSRNVLPELLPEFAHLSDVVRVIDVARETGGRVMQVFMNADLDEAIGLLAAPETAPGPEPHAAPAPESEPAVEDDVAHPETHWRWRMAMAERLAIRIDRARFGVKAIYVFGSTKNGTAGPASDLDLLVHDEGPGAKRDDLVTWLDGWSETLAEVNYLRTGEPREDLLDVYYVTDEDVATQAGHAAKIDAVTDAARPLPAGDAGPE